MLIRSESCLRRRREAGVDSSWFLRWQVNRLGRGTSRDPAAFRSNSQRRRGALRYVTQVMAARGYPLEDYRRADDLSVDHPVVVQNYRTARALALRRQRREAGTEEMRQAVVNYRALLTNFSCQCVTVIWVCERTNYHVQTETLPNSKSICLNGYTCLGEPNGRRDHTHPAAVSAHCSR